MEGGLNVLKDAVFYEPADQSTKLYVNLLVTAEGRQNDPVLQKLGTLYHTEAVKNSLMRSLVVRRWMLISRLATLLNQNSNIMVLKQARSTCLFFLYV